MELLIDGTGHDKPIAKPMECVPRVGEGIVVWGEMYEVIHVIWDLDKREVIVEVSQ